MGWLSSKKVYLSVRTGFGTSKTSIYLYSLLREYKHDLDPEEISTVIFAADEKRGDDAVYGAGWNCKVLIWDDADDVNDVVGQYRCTPACTAVFVLLASQTGWSINVDVPNQ